MAEADLNQRRTIANEVSQQLKTRQPEMEDAVYRDIAEINKSIVTAAKNLCRTRLTSRGAEHYASYYALPFKRTRIGIRNLYPKEGKWDISYILEEGGAKPHKIPVRDPIHGTLQYFWYREHMADTMSKRRGDGRWHNKGVMVMHSGIKAQHMMRDARSYVLEEEKETLWRTNLLPKIQEIELDAMAAALLRMKKGHSVSQE